MPDTVQLTKGSGIKLLYASPGVGGYYTPQLLDRGALQLNANGTWTEYQPDGLQLVYACAMSSSSSGASPRSAGSSGPSFASTGSGNSSGASSGGGVI
ncbi:MAG TPA: hypothetical protein VKU02_29765, partial [Gemmataceae bacterium]|nr:hypothetical protein [Gemmataceae bacterium]